MGTKNRFIRAFHQMDGTVEFNNIRSKAQRANLGYFPVSPLSFFKRVLSLTVVGCMLFATRMNTLVSYASESGANPVISKIDLDESIAVQKLYVGDTADSINFPTTLQATIDTYEEILVEVVEETPVEEVPVEEVPVEEVPEAEEPVEETPAEEVPVSEEEPAQEVEPAVEEIPVMEDTEPAPVEQPVEAPVEFAPVETAPATAPAEEPTIIEEVIDGAFNLIFPAITVKAAELENAEPVEEDAEPKVTEEVETTYKKETVKTSTTITLENVQWMIDAEQSTAAEFDSSVAGNTFVYVPVVETEYAVATALPTITVTIIEKEIEEVAFDAAAVVDGIVITVKADKGVFPEGATLSVKRPSSDQAEAAEEAVEEKEDAPLVEAYSFDISILNEEGLEIQPDNSKGKVTVSFALEEAANEDLNTEVYHMDEQVDGRFEAEKLDSTAVADTVTAETTGFSVYTVAITGGAVTFENDGYPYGKNMGDTPTLSIRVTNQGAKYQWQSSANKTSWTDIDGATSQDYSFTPTSGTWYRCKVNGAESKAVQMVKPNQDGRQWTSPMGSNSWYITNGKMAYCVNNGYFDVTGLYIKGGTSYMIQTTFAGQGWRMVTSSDANPSAGSGSSVALDDLQIAFNDNDEFAVIFMADLQAGQKGLSFGTDTMIASWDICEFSDSAALEATLNGDNTLKQISMIGANSSNDAADDDPAFVIAPITKSGLKFWVGGYSSRQNFSFASGSDSIVVDGQTIPNIRLKCNGIDSGMTMSWSNVADGGKVSFQFAVGDVASTGAVEGNVNYFLERIEGLTPGVVYTITEAGTNNTYTKTADINGGIDFTGKDNDNKTYDFIGKTLNFSAVVDDVNLSTTIAVAGRPVATEADTTGTADNTDATKPAEVGKDAVVSSTDSVTLNISVGDTVRMAQEYRIYDKDGNPVSGWISPNTNGTVKFNGLTKESDYTIKARIPAKQNVPASVPTAGVPVKTIGTIDIEEPEDLTTDYNGNAKTFLALADMEGVEISYSTDVNAEYTSEVPTFKMPGIYTVYYKATKEGYRSTYGSYQVIINKIEREKPIYIPEIKIDVNSKKHSVDLSDYIGEDDTATVNRVTGDITDYIYNVRIVDNVLTYDQRECEEEKTGNIVIKVENPIYRDNEVSIPITLIIRTAQEPVMTQEQTRYYGPILKKEIQELVEELGLEEETKDQKTEKAETADSKKNAKADDELEQKVTKLKEENKLVDKDEVLTNLSTETKKKLIDKLEEKGGQIVATDAMSIANATITDKNASGTNAANGGNVVDANKIPVNEVPVALVMGEGAVIVTMELSEDVKSSAGLADAKSVAKSILTEEQYARVASGSIVEIKVEAIPLDTTTVSDFDKQVIDDGVSQCMEELPNLTMGNYIDISMYMRIDDSDWNQITDTEQFEIVIEIPEEYRGLAEKYFIMRAHEGVSTLLEDLDDDPDTITIATGQFSTYAIMFDQTPVVEQNVNLVTDANETDISTIAAVTPFAAFTHHYFVVLILLAGFMLVTANKTRKEKQYNSYLNNSR